MKKFVLALAAMATLFTVSGGQDELQTQFYTAESGIPEWTYL